MSVGGKVDVREMDFGSPMTRPIDPAASKARGDEGDLADAGVAFAVDAGCCESFELGREADVWH